jgi:hypothetical protein
MQVELEPVLYRSAVHLCYEEARPCQRRCIEAEPVSEQLQPMRRLP